MTNVMEALPEETSLAFAANAELTGQPGISDAERYGTSNVQINISSAGLTSLGMLSANTTYDD